MYWRILAIAGLVSAAGVADVLAQGHNYPLPPGSYRQQCKNERVENGYLLRATCPKEDGHMRDASLDLRTCPRGSPVYNDGAYLKCGTGGGSHNVGAYPLPHGTYRQACRNERVENGYLLRATCPKEDGHMRDASLDLRTCPRGSPVYNDDAYLKCGTGSGTIARPGPAPARPWCARGDANCDGRVDWRDRFYDPDRGYHGQPYTYASEGFCPFTTPRGVIRGYKPAGKDRCCVEMRNGPTCQ
ncbi:MAG: CVNH domain-containing protein [Alphaproteobacteria bacterium]|nr:CVNH domain-containing protein [Alphaproteobacteria bacterium]